MSIEPTIKETDKPKSAGEERRVDREERHADRPSSTAEVAKDLEEPERAATSDDAHTLVVLNMQDEIAGRQTCPLIKQRALNPAE